MLIKDEHDRGVFATLSGHEGLVTCVQFLRDDAFASADDKGVVRCWRNLGQQACLQLMAMIHDSHT